MIRHRLHDEKWRIECIWKVAGLSGFRHPGNTMQTFLATLELYLWRLRRRNPARPRHLTLGPLGEYLVQDFTEIEVLREVLVDECYANPALPKTAKCIVDLGCNIGATLVWLRRRYPDARIIGVEADPTTAELASHNVSNLGGIVIDNLAISGRSGPTTFYRAPQQSWAGSLTGGGDKAISVEAISIDDLFTRHDLEHIDLMKIDIEGAEHVALGTAQRLRDVDVIVGEFHQLPGHDWEDFRHLLAGFEVTQLASKGGLADFIAWRRA